MNRRCGIVPCGSSVTPRRKKYDVPPIQLEPSANAREYPMSAQRTPTKPSDTTLIIIVLSAFFDLTSPP